MRMLPWLATAVLLPAWIPASEVPSRNPDASLDAHSDNIYWLTFDAESRRLLTASADNTAKVWDWASRRVTWILEHEAPVYAAAFSPGGELIATCSGDAQVALWNARDGKRLRVLDGHRAPVYCLAFSKDGRQLASGSGEPENECLLWDVTAGGLLARGRGHQRPVYGVAFSGSNLATSSGDQTLKLWTLPGLSPSRTLAGHTSDVYRCAFSPDGKWLASASQDKTVRLWDVEKAEARLVLTGHRDPVYGVAFSPDGKLVASAGDDRLLHIWNSHSPLPQAAWKGTHRDATFALTFAPDGTLLTAGAEGKVFGWKLPW